MNPTEIMKERIEEYENDLENYALRSKFAEGKNEYAKLETVKEKSLRYHIDYMRITNSFAFRRLRGKTQVFGPTKYDPPRCRLTHTLEVAEASRTVAKILKVNEDATVAIALGHDLGHTPFGHSGERALRKIIKRLKDKKNVSAMIGGFEHNWQSLRVVDTHELGVNFCGFNLSNDVREGILKHYKHYEKDPGNDPRYPDITDDDETKLYLKFPKSSSVEGQIVYLVDKIISAIHDIEDAYKLKVITWEDLYNKDLSKIPPLIGIKLRVVNEKKWPMLEKLKELGIDWPGENIDKVRMACTLLRIDLMKSLIEGTLKELKGLAIQSVDEFYNQRKEIAGKEIVKLKDEDVENFQKLKDWIYNIMINSDLINEADTRAEGVIEKLYDSFFERPLLLPKHILMRYELYVIEHTKEVHNSGEKQKRHYQEVGAHPHCVHFKQKDLRNNELETKLIKDLQEDPIFCRIIADYIAGMTDGFALEKAR